MADNTLDASFYDLLASEARLLSFIAIAKGDVTSRLIDKAHAVKLLGPMQGDYNIKAA